MLAAADLHARTAAQIDAVVFDEMAKQNIVGMAVGIVGNGRIYHIKGYGHADLARTEPITTDTLFRWASVSKTLTATAVLRLAEEDTSFSLNDKVSEHVSYWPEQGNKGSIRIRHLLSNRAGIVHFKNRKHCPDNKAPDYFRHNHTSKTYDAKQGVAVFKHQKLCFDPGENYKYSTFGYSLLGSAIEGGSGQSYVGFVNDKIKTPLGMSSLRQATGTVTGFNQACHILNEVSIGNLAWRLPGGGWESNVRDLAKFANALLQGSLLENTGRLWTTVPGNRIYSYGIFHTPDKSEVWHGGVHSNTRTLLHLYPRSADRLGIVLMINGSHGKAMRISHQLARLFGHNHDGSDAPLVKNCEQACDGRFSALWHKTGKDVLLRRGYTHDNFLAEWKFLRQAGYYSDDFEPYMQGSEVLWDAVFRKGSGGNGVWIDYDHDGFRKKWIEQFHQGYRLVDLETYVVDGERRWAGLFRPGRDEYAMYRQLTSMEFMTREKEQARQGYRLIDIEPYVSGGILYWAGVWRAGIDGLLNVDLNTKDFAELRSRRLKEGYTLIDIETYDYRGEQRWAGVWEKNPRGEKLNGNHAFCGVKNDAGDWIIKGITNRHNEWREQGYELTDWERH